MEAQRKVLACPDPGHDLGRGGVADLQVVLVARRLIPLHQQPAAVLALLPWVRYEDRFPEDMALARLDALARPLAAIVAHERVKGPPVRVTARFQSVEVARVLATAAYVKARKLWGDGQVGAALDLA